MRPLPPFSSSESFYPMRYTVQSGDTIAAVTKRLGTTWETIKKDNPGAVGKSTKNGHWFLKTGSTIATTSSNFQQILTQESAQREQSETLKNSTAANALSKVDPSPQAQPRMHTVQPGETIWELGVRTYGVAPQQILAINGIHDPKNLQVGQQIKIPSQGQEKLAAEVSESTEVIASWYGRKHQGRLMANGTPFDMHAPTIAHKNIPLGTKVELENPNTGEKANAVVTDRGPYIQGRDIDVSYNLAKRLSLEEQGVGNLRMRIL